jgi:hypothetical protein
VLLQRSRTGEKILVTPAGLTGLARWNSTTRARSAVLTGSTKMVVRIDEQAGLTGLAELATWSRK